ncbi:PKD domain-containing protein, partial [Thermococcus sp.]
SLMRMRNALALSEDVLPSVKVVETTSGTKVLLNPGFRGAERIMEMGSREFRSYLKWTIIREAKNLPRTLLDEPRPSRLMRLSKIAKGGAKIIPVISTGATLLSNYENWRRVVKEGGGWFRAAVTYNIQTKATSRTSGTLRCLNQKDISGITKPSFDNPIVGYILRKTLDKERIRRAIQRVVINLKVSEFEGTPPHDLYLFLNGIEVFDLEGVPAINREFLIPIDPEVIFPMSENEFSVLVPLYNPGYYGIVTNIQLEYIIDLSKLPILLDELTTMYLVGSNLSEVISYLNLLNREVYMSDGAIMHVMRSNEKGTENAPMLFLVELANKGNAETWTGVLTLYVNNTLVDAVEVGRLDPLESDYGMLTWIPNQSGTYSIEIRYEYLADSPVLDKDESNNVYRTEIEVLPAVPDFEIINVEFTALPGNVTISGTIENLGGYYNGTVELAVYVNNTLEKTLNETLGTFNVTLPLDIGKYNVTLIVDPGDRIEERNESNNVYSLLVEVKEPDTTPPLITINSPRSGIYGITEFDINVTVSDESNIVGVWAEFENESVELFRIPGTSFWIGSVSLPEGNTTLTIKALDEAGNEGNASVWLLIDLTSPNISILSPLNRTYNTRNITFEFTVSDPLLDSVETYLDGSSVSITSEETLEMDYGTHEFKVVATDKAGNMAERSVVFRINKPPLANFTWNANYLMVNFTSLSYDEDGEIVRFLWQFGDNTTSEEANPIHIYHKGGVYNVTLRVWDNDNATSSLTRQIVVYASVVITRTKEYTFERSFGFYNSTSWDEFREDFASWVNATLSNITLPFMDEFEHVNKMYMGEWIRVSYDENLSLGVEVGWINATYERNSTIIGIIDHNVTMMFIHEIVNFYSNATHVPDNNPPVITIIYPESNKTYDHNVTLVKVEVYDESPIKWVKAELDGTSYDMILVDGAWIANVTASDGNHTLIVTASDIYGNIGSANLSFAVNTSLRIIEKGNTTVTVIPGEVESEVKIENDTVNIAITLEGTTQLFTLPRRTGIMIDGRLSDNPWLAIYSNAKMERTVEESEQVTRGTEVYNVRKIIMEVNVSKRGYAVVMVPLHGMRPVGVVVEKNSTKYELTTKREKYGYFGIFGNYLYIVIFDDPIIEVILEQLDQEKTAELKMTIWRNLGLIWKTYYLRLREEFEELLSNVTNTTAIQDALTLHEQAEIYFNEAKKYNPAINPIMYSIYMRKAYITEKEALKLL